ncbi:hypothetical protein CR513_58951, partial [Mucuna pruriens]
VYDFNPLTPLDILTLSTNEHTNLDGKQKAEFVKELYVKVRANTEKRNEQYSKQANKGCVKVTFELGDREFDSMMNPFEEGRNHRNPTDKDKDHLHDIGGLMTRSKTKMRKQSLQGLSLGIKENIEPRESQLGSHFDNFGSTGRSRLSINTHYTYAHILHHSPLYSHFTPLCSTVFQKMLSRSSRCKTCVWVTASCQEEIVKARWHTTW